MVASFVGVDRSEEDGANGEPLDSFDLRGSNQGGGGKVRSTEFCGPGVVERRRREEKVGGGEGVWVSS